MALRACTPSVWRVGVAMFAATVGLVVAAIPAAGHTDLVGSTPADGATVTTGPAEVVLEFNQPVDVEFGQVAVLDETDGRHEQGLPVASGATVTQAVGDLVAGSYRISYRVASADGHPISGTLTFTVASGAATTQSEPTATLATRSPGTESNSAADDHSEHTTTPSVATGAAQPANSNVLLLAGGGIVG